MKHRKDALVLLAGFAFAASVTAADGRSGCPAGRGREQALSSIGGRIFASEAGHLRETAVTSHCLSCHDGTISSAVVRGPSRSSSSRSFLDSSTFGGPAHGGNHPVDIPYPAGRAGFRPISEVEQAIPLTGGSVTCESCHSGDESSPSRLTVTIELSRLCTTCHEK